MMAFICILGLFLNPLALAQDPVPLLPPEYIIDQLPIPDVKPDDEKFPNYMEDDLEARARAKEFILRYIQSYADSFEKLTNGNRKLLPRDLEVTISDTMDFFSSTDQLDRLRNIDPPNRMRSMLDTIAIRKLIRPVPQPTVELDPKNLKNYIQEYVNSLSDLWQVDRGSPYPLPGRRLIERDTLEKLKTLSGPNAATEIDAYMKGLAKNSVLMADIMGANAIARAAARRLNLKIDARPAHLAGIRGRLDELEAQLKSLESKSSQTNSGDFEMRTFNLKSKINDLNSKIYYFMLNLILASMALFILLFWLPGKTVK